MASNYTGACEYCGQTSLSTDKAYKSIKQANEAATAECDCELGKHKRERQKAINQAEVEIDDLFGSGAAQYELNEVDTSVCELLNLLATLLIDSKLKSVSLNITPTTKAKISLSTKGNIAIARSDTTAIKRET